MIKFILPLVLSMATVICFGQKKSEVKLNLTNTMVIAQLNDQPDRYSLEINMTDLLTSNGIKTIPSLNVLKRGNDAVVLASDSIQSQMKAKGFDTYLIVSVRGYDKRFKLAQKQLNFKESLSIGGLFDLYRQDIVSISFECKFYRNGEFVYGDIIKCGNISDRDTVLKRLRKKVSKKINKRWK